MATDFQGNYFTNMAPVAIRRAESIRKMAAELRDAYGHDVKLRPVSGSCTVELGDSTWRLDMEDVDYLREVRHTYVAYDPRTGRDRQHSRATSMVRMERALASRLAEYARQERISELLADGMAYIDAIAAA